MTYITQNICVFCASSDAVDSSYFQLAKELGKAMVKYNKTLVYGGADRGLMGALAHQVKKSGGIVIGIIPKVIKELGIEFFDADQLIVTEDLRERKAKMDEFAHAFIALPGGFGTFEEILEIITLKQLNIHQRPIIIINHNGFFEPLKKQIDLFVKERFLKPEYRRLLYFAESIDDAFNYLKKYKPMEPVSKIFLPSNQN